MYIYILYIYIYIIPISPSPAAEIPHRKQGRQLVGHATQSAGLGAKPTNVGGGFHKWLLDGSHVVSDGLYEVYIFFLTQEMRFIYG